MTICSKNLIGFSSSKGRKVQGQFSGVDITSDGGVMLLTQVDKQLKLTQRLSKLIDDPCVKKRRAHSLLLVYALATRI